MRGARDFGYGPSHEADQSSDDAIAQGSEAADRRVRKVIEFLGETNETLGLRGGAQSDSQVASEQ